jgi:hypothetical protein
MAARRSGSASEGQVLHNAPDWKDSVTLMNRECGTDVVEDGSATYEMEGFQEPSTSSIVTTSVENDILHGFTRISNWDSKTQKCVQSKLSRSKMGVTLHPGYENNAHRSLLMPGQPFTFAGDTTLTSVQDSSGKYFIKVDRLYGSESNEFTMVNVLKEFPALPPADTIATGSTDAVHFDSLPTPYSFSDMGGIRHPAVSTQSAVFFAVNPSLAMFKGFAQGCNDDNPTFITQLAALSSYAPIRIWKIEPYIFCPAGDDGRPGCGPGHVDFKDIPDAFTDISEGSHVFDLGKCNISFSVMVTNLEYINAENIAATVLRAPMSEFDPVTGALRADAVQATYKIMFISTVSMAIRAIPWKRDINLAAFAQGQLCPNMKRFPNFGSMFTETINAGASLIRLFTNLIVSLPGLIMLWDQQRTCSIVTQGHSLLKKCGSDLLSLDLFFDSLIRANAHYWRGFGIVAGHIRDAGSDRLANVVDGIAYYGDASSTPIGFDTSIIRGMRMPVNGMGTAAKIGMFPAGSSSVVPSFGTIMSINALRITQFSYNLVTASITRLIPLMVEIQRTQSIRALREVLQVHPCNYNELMIVTGYDP